jgi:hypothetical protein
MHFAPKGIEAAEIARSIGKQSYRVFLNLKKPGLGIVGIGCQDRRA